MSMNMKASEAIGLAMLDSGVEVSTYVPAIEVATYCEKIRPPL